MNKNEFKCPYCNKSIKIVLGKNRANTKFRKQCSSVTINIKSKRRSVGKPFPSTHTINEVFGGSMMNEIYATYGDFPSKNCGVNDTLKSMYDADVGDIDIYLYLVINDKKLISDFLQRYDL